MRVDIVIPAFNEVDRIEPTLKSYAKAMMGHDALFVVVDDGSSDATGSKVSSLMDSLPFPVRLIRSPVNEGKGAALHRGLLFSRPDAERTFIADADGATPASEFEILLAEAEAGADLVMASRGLGTEKVRQHWLRRGMGRTFNRLIRMALPAGFTDTQCGFKVFSPKAVTAILSKASLPGFAYDVEWIMICLRHGLVVREVAVTWNHVEASRVHIIKDSARMLRDLLRIRFRDRGGGYAS
ncbi:MAG: glycosyltransferase [Planctomycetota bacterium]